MQKREHQEAQADPDARAQQGPEQPPDETSGQASLPSRLGRGEDALINGRWPPQIAVGKERGWL
jgi:hypothetical protein